MNLLNYISSTCIYCLLSFKLTFYKITSQFKTMYIYFHSPWYLLLINFLLIFFVWFSYKLLKTGCVFLNSHGLQYQMPWIQKTTFIACQHSHIHSTSNDGNLPPWNCPLHTRRWDHYFSCLFHSRSGPFYPKSRWANSHEQHMSPDKSHKTTRAVWRMRDGV